MAATADLMKAFLEMKKELSVEIQQVRTDVTKGVEAAVANALKPLDERLQKCEAVMGSFEDRLKSLEKAQHVVSESDGGSASKRARSAPVHKTHQKVVVLCGFPKLSRKPEVEAFVEQCLTHKPEWTSLEFFAPNVRGSIAFVKVASDDVAKKFIQEWRTQKYMFKGVEIRARENKSPEKRKSDGIIYRVSAYLSSAHSNLSFDKDMRLGCIWHEDSQLVSWNAVEETLVWDEQEVSRLGIDKQAAATHDVQ